MIGEQLNSRYCVVSLLGSGRCGQTYLAEDTQAREGNRCVIKQFEPEAKDTLSLRKAKYLFAREVKILQILGRSDRIPKLLNHFQQAERFYLVHEFIEGEDLNLELGKQSWTTTEVWSLLQEILEIVEVAHREKVIHQDIKPSNIIRRKSDGKLMLIDFGSVKKINNQMANAEGKTSLTVPIGTAGYMAPEQKGIRPRLASDIYSVGMIGIYALTGVEPSKIPLDPDTEAVQWHSLISDESELTKVLDRMVSPELNQRYTSAGEALKAVRSLKLGGKSWDFKTIFGTGTLLLMIVGGGYYYWRLESSLHQTSEVEMFEQDQTQFPFLYRSDANGLSMKYPSNWRLTESEETKGIIATLKPEANESFLIAPEVNIEVDQSSTSSLDKYTTDTVYQITQLPQAKIVDSRPIEFADGNGHKVIYTQVNPDNDLAQKYLQIWTLKGDRAYKMSYHASIDDYPEFVETVEQEMFKSIQIE